MGRAGSLIRDAVVHRGEVTSFHVTLHRDGGSLVVAYEDETRYPYPSSRRIAMDDQR